MGTHALATPGVPGGRLSVANSTLRQRSDFLYKHSSTSYPESLLATVQYSDTVGVVLLVSKSIYTLTCTVSHIVTVRLGNIRFQYF